MGGIGFQSGAIYCFLNPEKKEENIVLDSSSCPLCTRPFSPPEDGVHVVVKCSRQAILNMSLCGNLRKNYCYEWLLSLKNYVKSPFDTALS